MINVVIADDQEMIRSGLRTILESEGDICVVGEAGDGEAALAIVDAVQPDLVLMDIRMPILDGIEATRRMPAGIKVLILTTFHLDEYVLSALSSGASGFLLKDATSEQLISAVRAVAGGDSVLSSTVTRSLVEFVVAKQTPLPASSEALEELSTREREVLGLLALGLSNSEISQRMYLSEATVKTHISRLLLKLKLRDRLQAVVYAYRYGLVEPM